MVELANVSRGGETMRILAARLQSVDPEIGVAST
jgi:hypothetical protein